MRQSTLTKQKIQEIQSVYEQKVKSMSQDNNELHKENLECKTELSNLKGKYEVLNTGYDTLKSKFEKSMPVSVHNTAIEECKRLFEELKQQYESDKKKLSTRVKYLDEIQPENERCLNTLTVERDHLKVQARNSEKNLK